MNATAISRFISRNYKVLRMGFLWAADAIIIFLSLVVAIFLYTRVVSHTYSWQEILSITGILFGLHVLAFTLFQIYRVSFQYASMLLTAKIVGIQLGYLMVAYVPLRLLFGDLWPPLVAVLAGLLATGGSVFLRLAGLIYLEVIEMRRKSHKQVLVYGAGESGTQIALALRNQRSERGDHVRLLGFLDDDPSMKGKIIYGYKILGGLDSLQRILLSQVVAEVIVAIPSLGGERIRELHGMCRPLNIAVKTLPTPYEVYNKTPGAMLSSLREVQFEDLLRRPRRLLSVEALEGHFEGKTVMVIGGGGSVGSELVSQLLQFNCGKVVVTDASELNLYQTEARFKENGAELELRLVDAKVRTSLSVCYAEHNPHLVFHAAAYKHVDLVEANPAAGVLNNLASMRNGAELAHEFGCEQFIFISSDKAVRPASVMGATKRIGELYVQSLNARSDCRFFSVRFGNVIGSSGSLIPNVISRIRNGESVQITHPEMSRYFMVLPEAASLILTSCFNAVGGEIFILDMGEPIKIVDLVRDLMMMMDRRPDVDVPIEFVGPRPGEKFEEELFDMDSEQVRQMDGFFVSTSPPRAFEELNSSIDGILKAGLENRPDLLRQLLYETIAAPTVRPSRK